MPKFRGTKEERDVLGAFVNLIRAGEVFMSRTHEHLGGEGLTIAEFAILEVLHHIGPQFQVDIGKRILRSRGSITMTIDKLEERQLVVRERKNDDRRCILVRLTAEGENRISMVFKKHLKVLMEEMAVLNRTEQQQLRAICKKLLHSAGVSEAGEKEG